MLIGSIWLKTGINCGFYGGKNGADVSLRVQPIYLKSDFHTVMLIHKINVVAIHFSFKSWCQFLTYFFIIIWWWWWAEYSMYIFAVKFVSVFHNNPVFICVIILVIRTTVQLTLRTYVYFRHSSSANAPYIRHNCSVLITLHDVFHSLS